MEAIETDELTKQYDGNRAVSDLDLTVREGEVYGFLGPNGAGKSTTIDMLMDYTRPTEGTATVLGMDTREEASAIHARTGILPDKFGVYGTLTGREHVRYILDANDTSGDPETALQRVGLSDAIDQRAGGYSKGMCQRLGLAMAIAGAPELLILDEPFSGLDPYGIRLVRELVAQECDRGATVFFSSHVLDQVERVCDRVGLISDGRLIAEGTPAELRATAGVETQLRVETDADETAVQAVEELSDVDGAVRNDGHVTVTCPRSTRPVVLETLQDAGAPVRSFEGEQGTIEDAFVELAE
ncbi:ABC transporter ATP-binding protein [Natronobacterium gregoryi]|uniref:ABC transporter ATP-binding protein n=2 Tax=Natronobacterium gregoryi TaxID=44930 RepID=L0AD27_NATGS|nr:ABC transporter ATP-binding protein [Natronobacterium gregoryi]AFZ71334.1 ABC-type multidrug transport system, ATPase component [Natronobacterium gregoryi SP2]ELY67036.1 ABC-type multidrug transport system, ATPase component [Natronobacterium gregoryi SP2]PLK18459.1 ABC transporter ATP-binding protein [Natronobacterium gregoryi SP2]SFJ70526.1 ABC-2 type transport system ATP-binding protein [Natronobacterium gregoryi]